MFIPVCVRVINDSVRSNGASVYREPPSCIVVIKLLMNSLMRLRLTKRKVIVNNAGTTPILSGVTCAELKKNTPSLGWMKLYFFPLMILGIAQRLKPFL